MIAAFSVFVVVLVCVVGFISAEGLTTLSPATAAPFYKGKRLSQLSENDRVEYWEQTYKTWPYKWNNESSGHEEKNRQRELEIMQIPGQRERWENWMQFVSGQMVPSFTKTGFQLLDTPPAVHAKLKAALDEGLKDFDAIPSEGKIDVIYGSVAPKFLNIGQLAWDINEELRPLHEAWAGGVELVGTSSYGIRLYQNGSSLGMHYDKIETHIISSIVHIGHEYFNDNEPWPIQIDDNDGNVHSVNLQPGQMLFYESARQLHGRMSPLKGKYYASIFTHYKPKNNWRMSRDNVIGAVPPHWAEGTVEPQGSRWSGQVLTIDSLACEGISPRVVNGEYVHHRRSAYSEL
jgi:hypothetical protein